MLLLISLIWFDRYHKGNIFNAFFDHFQNNNNNNNNSSNNNNRYHIAHERTGIIRMPKGFLSRGKAVAFCFRNYKYFLQYNVSGYSSKYLSHIDIKTIPFWKKCLKYFCIKSGFFRFENWIDWFLSQKVSY